MTAIDHRGETNRKPIAATLWPTGESTRQHGKEHWPCIRRIVARSTTDKAT
ncbi:hypothetical protein HA397_25900 [Escherichia coli]|nr:hypothetical protein [Escherichia coli]